LPCSDLSPELRSSCSNSLCWCSCFIHIHIHIHILHPHPSSVHIQRVCTCLLLPFTPQFGRRDAQKTGGHKRKKRTHAQKEKTETASEISTKCRAAIISIARSLGLPVGTHPTPPVRGGEPIHAYYYYYYYFPALFFLSSRSLPLSIFFSLVVGPYHHPRRPSLSAQPSTNHSRSSLYSSPPPFLLRTPLPHPEAHHSNFLLLCALLPASRPDPQRLRKVYMRSALPR
jgi:hypothetical protein